MYEVCFLPQYPIPFILQCSNDGISHNLLAIFANLLLLYCKGSGGSMLATLGVECVKCHLLVASWCQNEGSGGRVLRLKTLAALTPPSRPYLATIETYVIVLVLVWIEGHVL